jgi:putative pyruvate formate lyase activating enzyme
MPDFKFSDPKVAEAACAAPDYPEVARRALLEMHRQVGELQIGPGGLARRGLLVRHLVMPEAGADTARTMAFIAQRISPDTYVNVMPQYRPCGRAAEIDGFGRALSAGEYRAAVAAARKAGLRRLDSPRRVFMLR